MRSLDPSLVMVAFLLILVCVAALVLATLDSEAGLVAIPPIIYAVIELIRALRRSGFNR